MKFFSLFSRRDRHDGPLAIHKNTFPSWHQWRHLTSVLTSKERRLFWFVFVVTLLDLLLILLILWLKFSSVVPKEGGEYREALLGTPRFINPIMGETNDVDRDLIRLIFSGLLKRDAEGKLIPDLATAYETSDDAKTFTITLRSDAIWHDGIPVTTADVQFTIDSIKDSRIASSLTKQFAGVTATVMDDQHIRLTLRESFPRFPELLTLGILPKHAWEKISPENRALAELNMRPIGSGPWRFASFTKNQQGIIKAYTLERSSTYYGNKPLLKRLIFQMYPNAEEAIEAVHKDTRLGLSFLPKRLRQKLDTIQDVTVHSLTLPQYTALFFQEKKNTALAELLVRRALLLVLDRGSIIRDVLNDEGQVIDGPLPPGFLNDIEGSEQIQKNPEEAGMLLEKSGWKTYTKEAYQQLLQDEQRAEERKKARNQTKQPPPDPSLLALPDIPLYRIKNGKRLSFILTTTETPEYTSVAAHIKKQWETLGIETTIKTVPSGSLESDVLKQRNYEILLTGILFPTEPDLYSFWHSSQIKDTGLNLSSYSNKEVDKLLEESRKSTDPKERTTKLRSIEDILKKDLPAIFLYAPTYTYLQRSYIHGFQGEHVNTPTDRFLSLPSWYVKTKRVLR